jgi:hypothetical protein
MSRIAIGDAAVWAFDPSPAIVLPLHSLQHIVTTTIDVIFSHSLTIAAIYDLRSNVGSGSINQFVFASSRKVGLLARTRSHQ